jgi:hypothetical protein
MLKRHYLTAALVILSLAGGSGLASAAPIAHRQNPHPQFNERGFYDYAEPLPGYSYGYYGYWDPDTWRTGNGYY